MNTEDFIKYIYNSCFFSAFPRYLNQVHDVEMKPNQHWYCSFLAYFVLTFILISSLLLVSMTFERFYSIIRPHKAASFNTTKRAKITIACIYIFSVLWHIPHFFIATNNGKFCIQNSIASENIIGELHYWLSEVISFFFPFLSLLTMNCVIIHTLRQRSKQNCAMPQGQGQTEGQETRTKNSDTQIVIMLLLVTFAYLALTTPVKTLIFYLTFYKGNTANYYAGLELFYQVGEKTYYTNHGINFFLYVCSGHKFRNDLKNLFTFKRSE